MANNLYSASALAEYSLNLLRGQMITQIITGQGLSGTGGLSLTEYILGKKQEARRSGTDMMNDALTGLMRSDAAMLRQASKNMQQGKALLEAGGEGINSVLEKVKRMSEITAELQSNYSNAATLKVEYMELAGNIKSVIEGAKFNGISLLDGEKWGDDERIKVNGATGKLSLQAGNAPTELTLYDLQSYKSSFQATDLDLGNLTATAGALSQLETTLEGMRDSYKARAGLLDSESATFERQAGILDEATRRAKPGDEESLKQALIDILMRDSGSVLSGTS